MLQIDNTPSSSSILELKFEVTFVLTFLLKPARVRSDVMHNSKGYFSIIEIKFNRFLSLFKSSIFSLRID